ncbi:MAG: hypothetical protein ABWX74_00530, partial [Aeromicrobium sp.]
PTLAGACIYLGALSAILSIRAAVMVSTWNGGNRADEFDLALDALRDSGLSRSGAETSYKVLLTVVAVLAACGAVFAIFTARGDRASRIGLTIAGSASGLAAFIGFIGGGFLFSMIGALLVVFSARLWTGDIRTYFRTLAGHAPPPPKAPRSSTAAADPFAQVPVPSVEQPASVTTPGPTPTQYAPPPPGYYTPPPGYYAQQPGREPFPKSVGVAVWTAFIGSIVAASVSALMLLAVLAGALDYDTIMKQGGPSADMIRGSENDFDTVTRYYVVLSSISIVVGLVGLLASIRVLVTRHAGEVPLFVMTVVSLVVSVIGFPLGLPWTAAAIVALVHLRKPESRAWFSRT